jgi:N-acetylglucosaminyldiphosphoundecaprenol N-acetyl-beta-D-mannosaminyltransferase
MERVQVLGFPVDIVDLRAAADRLADLVDAAAEPSVVITLNPEMVMRARRDVGFARVVEDSALNVPDGIGLVRAARRRGADVGRVAGVDLVDRYLEHAAARKHRVALVGGGPGVAAVAASRYRASHPGLDVVIADGGDPGEATARRVAAFRPDVVFAAYGPGKQEMFLTEYLPAMGARVGMGVGGTFDFVAGRVKRAPRMVRRAGMEWAWRLALQPWRWRRQLELPKFWYLERKEWNS